MMQMILFYLPLIVALTGARSWTGRLYQESPSTGSWKLFRPSDVDLNDSYPISLRLVITSTEPQFQILQQNGDGNEDVSLDGTQLDLMLYKRTAWTIDSKVFLRIGNTLEEVPNQIDPKCFYTGSVQSDKESAVSFDLCNSISGLMEFQNKLYTLYMDKADDSNVLLIREVDTSTRNIKRSLLKRLRRSANEFEEDVENNMIGINDDEDYEFDDIDEDDEVNSQDTVYEEDGDVVTNETDISPTLESDSQLLQLENDINKRGSESKYIEAAAEVGIYLDKRYLGKLNRAGLNTKEKKINYMIHRWNMVKGNYSNPENVGFIFDIQLKHIELWETDPEFYNLSSYKNSVPKQRKAFCYAPLTPNVDFRMLYTFGIRSRQLGLAQVGGICSRNGKCAISNGFKRNQVKLEVHEFGHSLGLKHTWMMKNCTSGGFMGGSPTIEWADCYRVKLLSLINLKRYKCLRRQDVRPDVPVLNV